MENIKWEFIENSKQVSGGFDIIFNPRIDSLRFFLLATPVDEIPSFIRGLLRSEGGGGDQFTYIETFSNLDGGDLVTENSFAKDEIKVIHHIFGDVKLKKIIFYNVFYEFGLKELKRNQNNHELGKNWKREMILELERLKFKITQLENNKEV